MKNDILKTIAEIGLELKECERWIYWCNSDLASNNFSSEESKRGCKLVLKSNKRKKDSLIKELKILRDACKY